MKSIISSGSDVNKHGTNSPLENGAADDAARAAFLSEHDAASGQAAEDEKPPLSKTAVEVSHNSDIGIDYLAMTLHTGTLQAVAQFLRLLGIDPDGFEYAGYGSRHYQHMYIGHDGAQLMTKPRSGNKQHVHVVLPGKAASQITIEQFQTADDYLFANNVERECARLDVRIDTEAFTPEMVTEAIESGNLETRAAKAPLQRDPMNPGYTQYIGSRHSEKMARCYQKWRDPAKEQPYTRFELELKGSCAAQAWERLIMWGETHFIEHVYGFIKGFMNITLDWWEKFVGTFRAIKLSVLRAAADIEKTAEWIDKTVQPSLFVFFHKICGGDLFVLHDWILSGELRLKPRHKVMLSDQRSFRLPALPSPA